jgi:hypothetical protein
MSTMILGIDIGACGAIAMLTPAGALDVVDMLVLNDGPSGRRAVNAAMLAEIIAKAQATEAFVEYVGGRPNEGAVGAFSFGRSLGHRGRDGRPWHPYRIPDAANVEATCRHSAWTRWSEGCCKV